VIELQSYEIEDKKEKTALSLERSCTHASLRFITPSTIPHTAQRLPSAYLAAHDWRRGVKSGFTHSLCENPSEAC